ncbi:OmpH family outer membrane protein [Silvanigrella sp.]|jgi:outer membrane protein|uniref:OmpH family outer membrane protein n=1 Tax=Silvanigrella sp. TaxID=2024976 RepID=UPI0037C50AC6|nr:OmpH family outer membrane protein [Silvanigrellaceae bacterium]
MSSKIKKITFLASASLFLSSFSSEIVSASDARAQTLNSSKLKICVVNVQTAILQTNEGKAAKSKIEKEAEKDRQDILAKQNQLKKMEEDFQSQQSILSDSDKMAKQKEFQIKLQDYQKSQMSFEQKTRSKELAATQEIYQKITSIVKETRKKEECSMAFDSGAGVLLDADDVKDITSKIVEKYNSVYKTTDNTTDSKKENKKKG